MAKPAPPIPPGFHSVTPHLTVVGAEKYIDFLVQAFDATIMMKASGPSGKIMHATVKIGDSMVMLADHFPEFGTPPITPGYWPFVLQLYVPDADASWAKALAAGCTVKFPIADQFWGSRYGQVQDPAGFTWAIATDIEDLTPEELQERQAKMFGGAK